MACGIVRAAIITVVEKTPAKSPRSSTLRAWAQEILDNCQGDSQMEAFDKFSADIVSHLKEMILSVLGKYKLYSSKIEYLWKEFHLARMEVKCGKDLHLPECDYQ